MSETRTRCVNIVCWMIMYCLWIVYAPILVLLWCLLRHTTITVPLAHKQFANPGPYIMQMNIVALERVSNYAFFLFQCCCSWRLNFPSIIELTCSTWYKTFTLKIRVSYRTVTWCWLHVPLGRCRLRMHHSMHTHTYTHTHIYTYLYIYIERERGERELEFSSVQFEHMLHVSVCKSRCIYNIYRECVN